MKKLIQKLTLAGSTLFFSAQTALGFFTTDPSAPPDVVSTDTLGGTVTTIINYILGILGLVAVGFIIYAGVLMVTSAGNEEATGKAKKTITYAAIGILIILLSYSIVQFVTRVLTG